MYSYEYTYMTSTYEKDETLSKRDSYGKVIFLNK